MELKDYLRLLRRRVWLILICLLLGGAGAAVATSRQPQVYGSGLTFFLSDSQGRPVDVAVAEDAVSRFASYVTLVNSAPVLQQVEQVSGGDVPIGEVTASAIPTTIFLKVDVQSTTPQAALRVAQAYSDVFPRYVTQFEGAAGASGGTILQVLEPPVLETDRISPKSARNIAVGIVLGLILGLGSAVLLEALDARIRSTGDLERESRLSNLASVPLEHRRDNLVLRSHPRSKRAEAVRQVRANVQFAGLEHRIEILLVTSAVAGEGKTSVAADLAIAFVEAGQSVVLVDGDLRKPRVAEVFDLAPEPGLSDVMRGDVTLEAALRPTGDAGLRVLTSGRRTSSPSELLGSGRLALLLEELATTCDLVIIDSAPLLPVADTMTLLAQVDAVLLVALVGRTTRPQVRESTERLRSFQATVVGVIANGANSTTADYYDYSVARRRSGSSRHSEPSHPSGRGRRRTGPSPAPDGAVAGAVHPEERGPRAVDGQKHEPGIVQTVATAATGQRDPDDGPLPP